jgi:hypothetical protein
LLWHPVATQQISLWRDVAAGVGENSRLSQFDPNAALQSFKSPNRFAIGTGRRRGPIMFASILSSAASSRRLGVSFCAAAFLACLGTARAQEPWASGEAYHELRQSLMAKGWKPNTGYGLKTASGKLLYRYPEVVCGPTLCNAKWRDREGSERLISLLRGDGKEDYRVAP